MPPSKKKSSAPSKTPTAPAGKSLPPWLMKKGAPGKTAPGKPAAASKTTAAKAVTKTTVKKKSS